MVSDLEYDGVVFLKKLEVTSEYKADYSFAINNLLLCYAQMHAADDALNYVKLIRANEKSAQEDKFRTGLYAGLAYLQKAETAHARSRVNITG